MNSFNKYLQNFPHYTPTAFEKAKPFLSIRELEPGDYFLEQGKICRHIGFIEKGLFRLFYLNDGKEIINCFCKENTLTTSYRSLITQQASEIAIQAIERSTLIVLPNDALQELYAKDLFWQQVGRLVSQHEYLISEDHTRFLQDLSATEKYKEILANDPTLLHRVPLTYLASYLQITPETLSRIRKKVSGG